MDTPIDLPRSVVVQTVGGHLMALPPFFQTTRELNSLLSDPRLYNTLGGAEPIERIERSANGYVVSTQNYSVEVTVHYPPSIYRAGPARFELEFGPRQPTGNLQSVQSPLGALPPLANSLRELSAILNDRRLSDALGSGAFIESIQRTESGYLITTAKETLEIEVIYFQTDGRIGPGQFELVFAKKKLRA